MIILRLSVVVFFKLLRSMCPSRDIMLRFSAKMTELDQSTDVYFPSGISIRSTIFEELSIHARRLLSESGVDLPQSPQGP